MIADSAQKCNTQTPVLCVPLLPDDVSRPVETPVIYRGMGPPTASCSGRCRSGSRRYASLSDRRCRSPRATDSQPIEHARRHPTTCLCLFRLWSRDPGHAVLSQRVWVSPMTCLPAQWWSWKCSRRLASVRWRLCRRSRCPIGCRRRPADPARSPSRSSAPKR
jgi:hypothetical protein